MIRTVAEFLIGVRDQALIAMDGVRPINHAGMIGDMYEGLTRDLLERSVFEGLDLRIVQGKVLNAAGDLSDQIDCMVVVGDGEQLPFSPHFLYPVDRVICVVEVKKTLYRSALGEAYANLNSVVKVGEPRELRRHRVLRPFRTVAGVDLLDDGDVNRLPIPQQYIYHSIVGDVLLPVRVALGYFGYASEHTLREGFWHYLQDKRTVDPSAPVRGYSPFALPSLIVAGDNALVKLNGMPYALRSSEPEWLLYGSVAGQSVQVLLELVWSRLASQFGLNSEIFGEDLELEQVNPLLAARIGETADGKRGWTYELISIPAKKLKQLPPQVPWTPAVLDQVQFTAMNILCKRGEIVLDEDADLHGWLTSEGLGLSEFIDRMLLTGFTYVDPDRRLRLLTDECVCAIDPELGFVAAENQDGRFERWLMRRVRDKRAE
jgi:hypothetical protein